MNAVKKIVVLVAMLVIVSCCSGCSRAATTRYYIHQGGTNVVYGSEQWIRYMERLCPEINWDMKECRDAKQIKEEHKVAAYAAGQRTPEQLAEQKREWDNVQKWFGFYNQVEGMNQALGNPSYNPQQKEQNRAQDQRRSHCLASCNASSSGSVRAYQSCQTYCSSMFPEL